MGLGMLERFEGRVNELELVVRELANDITTGTVVDRIPPEKLLPFAQLLRKLHQVIHLDG